MFNYLLLLIIFCPQICFAQKHSSNVSEVEKVLKLAGKNRVELQKAISYFDQTKHPLKIKAIQFLIANMAIHYSRDYYWADSMGVRIPYNETDYNDFASAISAFELLKVKHIKVKPVPYTYKDIDTIKASFLIDNVERAFAAWEASSYKKVSFEDFCEDILPYRVSTEPLQQWRKMYQERFSWLADSAKSKNTELLLNDIGIDFKSWFVNTWDLEQRADPLPRLGPLQLLTRKKGNCDDIGDLEVYLLRSQGYPARLEHVPYWATTTGRHYFNSTLDEQGQNLPFDISTPKVKINSFSREPSKVVRITYSIQPKALANLIPINQIPDGFLRMPNYVDVTSNYWETSQLSIPLFKTKAPPKIVFACVFNGFKWQPTWWSFAQGDVAVFDNMCKGAVFLPMFYSDGKLMPSGDPVASGYKHKLILKADMSRQRNISIKQQDKYLIFRADKNYKLYYWKMGWKLLGVQKATDQTTELVFTNAPRDALFLLIPEYTQGKERPFIIDDEGERIWF